MNEWIKADRQKPVTSAPVWVWDGVSVSIDNFYESDVDEIYPMPTVEGKIVYVKSSGWYRHRQEGVIAWMQMDVPYPPEMVYE